jgi:hypothetical protein
VSCDMQGYTFPFLAAAILGNEMFPLFYIQTIKVHFRHSNPTDMHLENLVVILKI